MSARIVITNTARATIRETWTFTVPDCFTLADGTRPESLFDVLMHAEGVERDCADEVIGDEEDREDFRIVEMGAVEPEVTFHRVIVESCDHTPLAVATCGGCHRSWCSTCDPGPSALCPWCHGRGYSTAPRVSS